eukprot:9482011-Pyramimonas_sp.AAC.1
MIQIRIWDLSKNSSEDQLRRTRALRWTCLISGETAMEMARQIEALFATPDLGPSRKPIVDHPEKATKIKLFNPKFHACQWVNKSAEWAKLYRGDLAKLESKTWAKELLPMLDQAAQTWDAAHSQCSKLEQELDTKMPKDVDPEAFYNATFGDVIEKYRQAVQDTKEPLEGAANMLNIKKRKAINEPLKPSFPKQAVPAPA